MNIRKTIARHVFAATLAFKVWYPAHPPRAESVTFRRSRKALIEDNPDAACRVCGVKTGLELHHFWVEWAFADAIDWAKMRDQHPTFDWSTFKAAEDFVDSLYNTRDGVLCAKHHRLHGYGIHNLPYPIWLEQLHAPADWTFSA